MCACVSVCVCVCVCVCPGESSMKTEKYVFGGVLVRCWIADDICLFMTFCQSFRGEFVFPLYITGMFFLLCLPYHLFPPNLNFSPKSTEVNSSYPAALYSTSAVQSRSCIIQVSIKGSPFKNLFSDVTPIAFLHFSTVLCSLPN